SAMGGVLKYVTQQPDPARLSSTLQSGVSDTNDGSVNFNGAMSLNAPVADGKAAVRAGFYYSRDRGYIDNLALGQKDVNRSNTYGGRLDLLLSPIEDLQIRIGGFLQNISRDGQGNADYTFAGTPQFEDLEQSRKFAEPFEQHFRLVSATATYSL